MQVEAKNVTPDAPQRRRERRGTSERLPEGSIFPFLLREVSASSAPLRLSNIRLLAALFFALHIVVSPISVMAQDASATPGILGEVGFDQKLDAQVPLDLNFRDESGRAIRLGDYFGDKPVILSLIYYDCPMLCTLSLNGLINSLSDLRFDAGREFNVVTVSFDPREKPELAAAKKELYVKRYGRRGADAGWRFLTGDGDAIRRLTEAVGFRFAFDPRLNQFAHPSGIVVLTPQGKVARYFYGIEYEPKDLRLGLIEASANRIGSPTDKLMLLCYHYDPSIGKYTGTILNLLRLGGAATLFGLTAFIFAMIRKRRRKIEGRETPAGV